MRLTRPVPLPADRRPRVSVIVPCYNYGHYLPDCVMSAVLQPGVEVDVLVVDDASSDGSARVAAELADHWPAVRTVVHRFNKGHIATYNEGLEQADGDYVVLLSADDLLTPGALARSTALMEAMPSVGLVYGNPVTFSRLPPQARQSVRCWSVWPGADWIESQLRRGLSIIYSPEAVVRTSVQRAAGGYASTLPYTADIEMWLRLASLSDVGRVNGPDQAFRRQHPASMMQMNHGSLLADLKVRLQAYDAYCDRLGSATGERLRALAHRTAAADALDFVCSQLARADLVNSFEIADELAPYLQFAQAESPDYHQLRGWVEYRLRTSGRGRLLSRLPILLHSLRRDAQARLRWQRWYRIGV